MTRGKLVVLSPHPDDAIWSIGGVIARLAKRRPVLIISVFDGDASEAAAEKLRDRQETWRVVGSPFLRRREDVRASQKLDAQLASLRFEDAAIRLNAVGDFSYSNARNLFCLKQGVDLELAARIANSIKPNLNAEDSFIVPAGIGGHIDHRTARISAEILGRKLFYYEDFPYVMDVQGKHVERMLPNAKGHIIPGNIELWMQSSLSYKSQVLRLLGSEDKMRARLKEYAGRYPSSSVRIWRTASV